MQISRSCRLESGQDGRWSRMLDAPGPNPRPIISVGSVSAEGERLMRRQPFAVTEKAPWIPPALAAFPRLSAEDCRTLADLSGAILRREYCPVRRRSSRSSHFGTDHERSMPPNVARPQV